MCFRNTSLPSAPSNGSTMRSRVAAKRACVSETQGVSWCYEPQRRNSTICPPWAAQSEIPPLSTGRAATPFAARIEAAITSERHKELNLRPGETVYVEVQNARVFADDYSI